MNPLVEGDRPRRSAPPQRLPRLMAEPDNAALRALTYAPRLLENRAADDGTDRRRDRDRTSSSAYALATALLISATTMWGRARRPQP